MRVLARLALALAGLIIVARLVVAVTITTTSEVVPASGGVYSEGLVGQPGQLTPLLAAGNPCDSDIAALVFSGLTQRDEIGRIVADLAESWLISADARTYTFTLRTDARWHDGAPVTADDVVFTVAALQGQDLAVTPWLAALWRGVVAEKISLHSVRLVLPEPYAPFLQYTTIGLLPAHLLQGTGEQGQESYSTRPIGTGRYVLSERNRLRTTLRAFDGYPAPMIPTLEFTYYDDRALALAALSKGEIMAVANVSSSEATALAEQSTITVQWAPRASQTMIYFNLSLPFFEDAPTRRALATAIDRQAIVNGILDGKAFPSNSPFLSSSWASSPGGRLLPQSLDCHAPGQATGSPLTPTVQSSIVQAAAMLDTAGWKDADRDGVRERNGVKLEFGLLTSTDPAHIAVATAIGQAWTQIGAAIEVQAISAQTLLEDYVQPRRFEAVLIEWANLPDDPDPYELWHSSQRSGLGLNLSGYASQTADELMEQARQTGDQAQRKTLYGRVQTLIADSVPAVSLYEPMFGFAVSDSLKLVRLSYIGEPADRFRHLAEWYTLTRTITTTEQIRSR